MFLSFVLQILLPVFRLRATLLLRDVWLSWSGIASATLQSSRMIAAAKVAVALILAYIGVP